MTTFTTIIALIPVLISTGRGADVAKAMAWPVFGGMLVELLTLFVVPVVFCGFKELKMNLGLHDRHWEGTELITGGVVMSKHCQQIPTQKLALKGFASSGEWRNVTRHIALVESQIP